MSTFIIFSIILLLSIATISRNSIWHNPITLWTDASQKSPHKWRPHNNLGAAYFEANNYESAIEAFKKSHAIRPNYYDAINIGNSYLQLGQYNKAAQFYHQATNYQPSNPESYFLLGNVYSLIDPDIARKYFEFATKFAKNAE